MLKESQIETMGWRDLIWLWVVAGRLRCPIWLTRCYTESDPNYQCYKINQRDSWDKYTHQMHHSSKSAFVQGYTNIEISHPTMNVIFYEEDVIFYEEDVIMSWNMRMSLFTQSPYTWSSHHQLLEHDDVIQSHYTWSGRHQTLEHDDVFSVALYYHAVLMYWTMMMSSSRLVHDQYVIKP